MFSEVLRVEQVSAAWDGVPVLREVSLSISGGELLTLLGPNGSGKTTLLRIIAGLEPPTAGSIYLNGRRLDGMATHHRGIGLLNQDAVLFPGRDVYNNIAYGLYLAHQPAAAVRERVSELVRLLHLEGLEKRKPQELSGGQRQRVALARALAPGPNLLLLDEPFASLDASLRTELRSELRPLLRANHTTALHVTHDLEEGLFLGDRVALLDKGRLLQAGPPSDVFRRPASESAARMLGYNLIDGPDGIFAAHPSEIEVVLQGPGELPGIVEDSGFAGVESLCHVRLASGKTIEVRRRNLPPFVSAGAKVGVRPLRPVLLGRPEPIDPDTASGH